MCVCVCYVQVLLCAVQEQNFNLVLDVLTRFRAADVEKAVGSLNCSQVDTLMKYVYRGFASPTENSCGILLVWHEKVGVYCWLVGIKWIANAHTGPGSRWTWLHCAYADRQEVCVNY